MILPEEMKTKRCTLSLINSTDVEWLHTLLNDKEVQRFLPGIKLFSHSISDTNRFIHAMELAYQNSTGYLWKIMYQNEFCGFVCMIDVDDGPSCSYAIQSTFRNKGIMNECLTHLFTYFGSLGMKIHMEVDINNAASMRLSQKLASLKKFVEVTYLPYIL